MTEIDPIRLLIVDDHAVMRTGLKLFLVAFDDLDLVGEAANGEEAVRLCNQIHPDVVLMDLVMPGMDGATATRTIRRQYPGVQVIVLTNFQDVDLVQQALQAGAIGYLLKDVPLEQLIMVIREASKGVVMISPAIARKLTSESSASENASKSRLPDWVGQLSRREKEILPCLFREGSWQGEQAILARDGTLIPTLQNSFLIRDENEEPFRLAVAVADRHPAGVAQTGSHQGVRFETG